MATREPIRLRVTERSGGLREVGALAAPFVLSQILITTMGVVDAAIVGRLGASELAAVGLAGMWAWALASFFVGASTAVQTFVAQHHGANEPAACGGWCWQGMASVGPPAALVGCLVFAGAPLVLEWIEPSERVAPLAQGYLRARAIGLPGIALATALSGFFRGIGDARTPFVATVVANAVNLVLDFGLVYGWLGFPQLGVVGAGLATAISEWIYAAVVAIAFARPRLARAFGTRPQRPDLDAVRRLWRVGLPIGGQWVTEMAAFALFTSFVARMGDAALAASHAFVQIMSLAFMQAEGISLAASTLVGRYIGAERVELARRSYRSSMIFAGGLTAISAVLFLTLPERLIGLFTSDPAVLAFAGPLLSIGALYQFFDVTAIVADGALRGAGDTTWPFAVRSALSWLVMIPCAWVGAYALDGGLQGAWLGALVAIFALAAALVLRFHSGAWQRVRI